MVFSVFDPFGITFSNQRSYEMSAKLELILDKAFSAIAEERKMVFAAFEKSMDQIKEITVEAIRSLGKQDAQQLIETPITDLKPAQNKVQPKKVIEDAQPAPAEEKPKPKKKKQPKKVEAEKSDPVIPDPEPAPEPEEKKEEAAVEEVAAKPKKKKTTKKKKKEEVVEPEIIDVGSNYTAEEFTAAVIADTERERKEKEQDEEGLDESFKDEPKPKKKKTTKKKKKAEVVEPDPEPTPEPEEPEQEPDYSPVDLDLNVEDIRDDLPPDNLPKGFHDVWAKMNQLERRNLVKSFAKEGTNPNDPPLEERIATIKKPVEKLEKIEDIDEQEYLCEVMLATMMLDALTEQELADTWAELQQGDKKSPKLFLDMIALAEKGKLPRMFDGVKIAIEKQEGKYWGFADNQTTKTAKFIQELEATYKKSGFIEEVDKGIRAALGIPEDAEEITE